MTKSSKAFGTLMLAALSGCSVSGPIQEIAPFPDQPTETYAFQYTTTFISGPVWAFERNGQYVSYGGPLGFI